MVYCTVCSCVVVICGSNLLNLLCSVADYLFLTLGFHYIYMYAPPVITDFEYMPLHNTYVVHTCTQHAHTVVVLYRGNFEGVSISNFVWSTTVHQSNQ